METTLYKAMLALTTDERRALNTFAAIASTTPNRYVESMLRAQLRRDGEALGLPLAAVEDDGQVPGQLPLPEPPTKTAAPRRRTPAKAKQEKTTRRRTGK